MASKRSTQDYLAAAKNKANAHGMYIVTKSDCYLVYRRIPNGPSYLLGRRTTPQRLLSLVESCAASTTS